jgi:hypothetical protein
VAGEPEGAVTALAVVPRPDRAVYAETITKAWRQIATDIIEIGKCLLDAKATLPHGEFTAMVETELPFGPRTARRLMAVARHPVLADGTHASVLPASWMTLYELTKVEQPVLEAALADGRVNAGMERKDAVALRPVTVKHVETAVVADPPEAAARPFDQAEDAPGWLPAARGLERFGKSTTARDRLMQDLKAALVVYLFDDTAGKRGKPGPADRRRMAVELDGVIEDFKKGQIPTPLAATGFITAGRLKAAGALADMTETLIKLVEERLPETPLTDDERSATRELLHVIRRAIAAVRGEA